MVLRTLPDNRGVGFAVWIEQELAWAAGTYEYRAMGVAVISRTDLFRRADFRQDRRAPPTWSPGFVGNFASIGQVNAFLIASRPRRRRARGRPARVRGT